MTTDNQTRQADATEKTTPAPPANKTAHDPIKDMKELLTLLPAKSDAPTTSLANVTANDLYGQAKINGSSSTANLDKPLDSAANPSQIASTVLDLSTKTNPDIYAAVSANAGQAKFSSEAPGANENGTLTFSPLAGVPQEAAVPHVRHGTTDLLDYGPQIEPSALQFDSTQSAPSHGYDLVQYLTDAAKDGKTADDPVWQKYIDSAAVTKIGTAEWKQFINNDAQQLSNSDAMHTLSTAAGGKLSQADLEKLLAQKPGEAVDPKLKETLDALNGNPAFKHAMEAAQKEIANDPKWRQLVASGEIQRLQDSKLTDKDAEQVLKNNPALEKTLETTDSKKQKDVAAEHQKLSDWADHNLQEPDRSNFKKDMSDFETRANRDGLSPDEVVKTYKQIERLADADGVKPLTPVERQHVLQQVMHQAADPTSIDQGYHSSCSVAAVESRTYTRSPSDAARLVADVAMTGEYRTANGTIVKVNPRPHGESYEWPTKDGDRSYASEIFQVTAANIHWVQRNHHTDRQYRYEQREPNAGDPSDTGERKVDYSKHPPRLAKDADGPVHSPDLDDRDLTEISNAITGKKETDVQIEHEGDHCGSTKGTLTVKNEEELKAKLKDLKDHHRLPVIIRVESANEPFYTDSGQGAAGGSGGAHFVTVTDYDENTGEVCVDNQWGKKADHGKDNPVKVHDLYVAMESTADAEKSVAADVQYNKEHGIVDPVKEQELLRYKYWNGEIKDDEYAAAVKKSIADTQKRWDAGGVSEEEKQRERQELGNLIHLLPLKDQLDDLSTEHQAHILNDKQYENELVVAGKTLANMNQKDPAYQQCRDKYRQILDELSEAEQRSILTRVEDPEDEQHQKEKQQ